MIRLKTESEMNILAEGGAILAQIVATLTTVVRPGLTTAALDARAAELMQAARVKPAFLGYRAYPAVICTSVNSQVVHGIPSADVVLTEGDIVGLDVGIIHKGLYTDMAVTLPVGKVSRAAQRLIKTANDALERGIAALAVSRRLGAVSAAVQSFVERQGYGVVRDLCGHGVGYELHEDPAVPNFGSADDGPIVQPGLVLAIEPMITAGDWHVRTKRDGWTVETLDGSLSAHVEHTVAVIADGVRVLTKPRA